MIATFAQHLRLFKKIKQKETKLLYLAAAILFVFIGVKAHSQTCQGLFEKISMIERFSIEDQETLTTLARRQVEISSNFSISTTQKQNILKHLDEQVEEFIASRQLNTTQERVLRQEYRSLVFQFKKELTGEMDNQTRIAGEKQKVLDQQVADQVNLHAINSLMKKYRVDNLDILLHVIMESRVTPESINDFKLALDIKEINVNAGARHNERPLHIAVMKLEVPFFEILIKSPNLDVNLKDDSGITPLENTLGRSPKDTAISNAKLISSHPSFDPNIISHLPVIGRSFGESRSLFDSAILLNSEIARIIASHPKFDISSKNSLGRTPLHLSCEHPEIVKLLISRGADSTARDSIGNTPLHFAAQRELTLQSLELLINDSADINAKNNDDRTALQNAISYENVKAVELLLNAKGIDINIRNENDSTPLAVLLSSYSISAKEIKIIELLKSKGATR